LKAEVQALNIECFLFDLNLMIVRFNFDLRMSCRSGVTPKPDAQIQGSITLYPFLGLVN